MIVRPSRLDDLSAIQVIYAHHVRHGTGTFEIEPPTLEDMTQRWRDVQDKGLPYLVACVGPQVLGYAYCNWFKPRPAYRFSAEDSVYVHPDAVGQGIGRALLAELCAAGQRAGLRKLIAVIGDSANHPSIRLHQGTGFVPAGQISACGWKFDRWLDIVLMEKPLGLGASHPPVPAID